MSRLLFTRRLICHRLMQLTMPLTEAMDRKVFKPTKAERELIGQLKTLSLKTTLFRADAFPKGEPVYPGEVWVGPLNKFNGHVRYLTNSDLAVNGHNIEYRPSYVAYQSLDEAPTENTNDQLRDMFSTDIGTGNIGLERVEILYEKVSHHSHS
jgi:hypothetical protein